MLVLGVSIPVALRHDECDSWEEAIERELDSLENTRYLTLKIPTLRKIYVPSQVGWYYRRQLLQYKARLIAHDFKQRPGQDCTETSAPLIDMHYVRLLMSACIARESAMAYSSVSLGQG